MKKKQKNKILRRIDQISKKISKNNEINTKTMSKSKKNEIFIKR